MFITSRCMMQYKGVMIVTIKFPEKINSAVFVGLLKSLATADVYPLSYFDFHLESAKKDLLNSLWTSLISR